MSYTTNIVNFPRAMGSTLSCQDQHTAWEKEQKRVQAIAAELGPVAVSCVAEKTAYELAVAKHESAKHCAQQHAVWSQKSQAYNAYLVFKKNCDTYQSAKVDYDRLVNSISANNNVLKTKWLSDKASVDRTNSSLGQQHKDAQANYAKKYSDWEEANRKYNGYRAAVMSQSYGVSMQWSQTQRSNPDYFSKYDWALRTKQCDSDRTCVTAAWKKSKERNCVVVRGLEGGFFGSLGSTLPKATDCQYFRYYPTCPEKCPSNWAPNPGVAPTPPTEPKYLLYPPEPAYQSVPTFEAFLKDKGMTPMDGCQNTPAEVNPGNRPSCDPTIPMVPNQPTCSVPNIPEVPPKPTCTPTKSFAQMGPMWLVLALGAGGLYWYSKKK